MRNLVLFIQRFYLFLVFLLLEFFAFFMIYQQNTYHQASFVNTANTATGKVYTAINNFRTYFNLRKVNDELQTENARLRRELLSSYYHNKLTLFNINDTLYKQQYEYITAHVINNSINRRNNFITIDRGHAHGVQSNMAVICEKGIVGIVMDVSENFSTVLSLLNSHTKISAKLAENNNFGSLVWDGKDPFRASLLDVNQHVPVKVGQDVVTSGFSTIFPENIPIGKVYSHKLEPGDNFHSIQVELSTNFTNLSAVYIVRSLMKAQVDSLENSIRLDN